MNILTKPEVLKKLRKFHKHVTTTGKMGSFVRGIDINFNNACNFKCAHCFTKSSENVHPKDELPIDTIANLADQAHELGIFEFDLQGGELLLRPDKLINVIRAIQPERFYLYLTTNGYYLDKSMAKRLARAGVSRVSVSIDSMKASSHDSFRGKHGAHKRALKALEFVKSVGIEPYLNVTVGHYNIFESDFERLLAYSKSKGYSTLINVAVPSGCWQDMDNVMLDETDQEYLKQLRKKYTNTLRDIWNPFDKSREAVLGCNCVNRTYITPLGDVLVCPYVHIKIGNVFESSLADIIDYGFSIPQFRDYSPLCLAGEDKEFVSRFMTAKGMSVFNPLDARKTFN